MAAGNAELPFHQIQTGDHLGDRMLDLQAGIHLHEKELAALIHDEFDRTGADVTHGSGGGAGRFAHGLTYRFGQMRGGRFFDDFLMAALQGTVALEQEDTLALLVCENLNFHVARTLQILFYQHLIVAEAGKRFALARGEGGGKLAGRLDNAHAFAATACAGLDQHRITDPIGLLLQVFRVLVIAMVAGDQRYAGFAHQGFGRRFRAHRGNRGNRWTDEADTGGSAGLGKGLVFREKPVTRMDGAGLACLGDVQNTVGA